MGIGDACVEVEQHDSWVSEKLHCSNKLFVLRAFFDIPWIPEYKLVTWQKPKWMENNKCVIKLNSLQKCRIGVVELQRCRFKAIDVPKDTEKIWIFYVHSVYKILIHHPSITHRVFPLIVTKTNNNIPLIFNLQIFATFCGNFSVVLNFQWTIFSGEQSTCCLKAFLSPTKGLNVYIRGDLQPIYIDFGSN